VVLVEVNEGKSMGIPPRLAAKIPLKILKMRFIRCIPPFFFNIWRKAFLAELPVMGTVYPEHPRRKNTWLIRQSTFYVVRQGKVPKIGLVANLGSNCPIRPTTTTS